MNAEKITVEIKLDQNLMCLLERLTNILQKWVGSECVKNIKKSE